MPPDRLIRNGFRFLALLLPPVAALAFKGLVPLLCVAALPILAGAWRQSWRPRPRPVPTALLGALLLWCAIASLWSYDAGQGLFTLLRNGTLIALGVLLWDILDRDATRPEADAVIPWIVGGCALGAAVILLEIASDHILFRTVTGYAGAVVPHGDSRLNRGAMALALLVFFTLPYGRRLFSYETLADVGTLSLSVPAIVFSESTSSQIAFIFGILTYLTIRVSVHLFQYIVLFLIVSILIFMPMIANNLTQLPDTIIHKLPGSIQHRIQIWDFTADRINERALLGWGYGSSRDIPNFGVKPMNPDFGSVIPVHPHNAFLEIWIELGCFGAALVSIILFSFLRFLYFRRASISLAVTVTAISISATGYGLWQEHWISTLTSTILLIKILMHQHLPSNWRKKNDL